MSSEALHENRSRLRPETVERHRAISSLMEELEAIDWYDQRVDVADDQELKAILAHNRDEEKEHASMLLEWLRRHDPVLDGHLRTYLFNSGSIVGIGADVADSDANGPNGATGLDVGALRDKDAV